MTLYFPAISQKEAAEIVGDGTIFGWKTLAEAELHMLVIKQPPTDPYYAAQYRVYKVDVEK